MLGSQLFRLLQVLSIKTTTTSTTTGWSKGAPKPTKHTSVDSSQLEALSPIERWTPATLFGCNLSNRTGIENTKWLSLGWLWNVDLSFESLHMEARVLYGKDDKALVHRRSTGRTSASTGKSFSVPVHCRHRWQRQRNSHLNLVCFCCEHESWTFEVWLAGLQVRSLLWGRNWRFWGHVLSCFRTAEPKPHHYCWQCQSKLVLYKISCVRFWFFNSKFFSFVTLCTTQFKLQDSIM